MAADKERDPDQASVDIGKYLDILAKDPNSRVFAPLAEAYRKAGLLDDAIETALEGLKVHPNYLGGRVALGRAYFEKRQYAEAAAEMQKVVKSAPDNIIAHKVLGQIAYSQGDLPTALQAFKMVLLLDPRDQEAQQLVGNIGGSPPAPEPPAATRPQVPPPEPVPMPVHMPVPDRPSTLAEPSIPVDLSPEPAPGPELELPLEPLDEPSLAPLALDEIQPLDEPEFNLGMSFEEVPHPVATPAPPPLQTHQEMTGIDLDSPLDFAENGFLPDASEAPAALSEAGEPPLAPSPPPEVAEVEEESPFEVFGRPKRGGPPPTSTKGDQMAFGEIDLSAAASEPEQSEPEPASDSPFEVFTRTPGPRTPPPPPPGRGEGAGPREIEVETTAFDLSETYEPAEEAVVEPSLVEDLPGLDLSETSAPAEERAPGPRFDEGLPGLDLAQDVDFGASVEPLPTSEPAPQPVLEPEIEAAPDLEVEVEAAPELELEVEAVPDLEVEPVTKFESVLEQEIDQVDVLEPEIAVEDESDLGEVTVLEPELEPEAEHVPEFAAVAEHEPEPAPQSEFEAAQDSQDELVAEMDLDDELSVETEEADSLFSPDSPETSPWDEPAEASIPAAETPQAGRGVFDTETLATIYIDQGFYGRAAEIYQRLVTERPDDAVLRRKLEETLALESAKEGGGKPAETGAVESDTPQPVQQVAQTAPPAHGGPDRMISGLQALLEAFKGGRP